MQYYPTAHVKKYFDLNRDWPQGCYAVHRTKRFYTRESDFEQKREEDTLLFLKATCLNVTTITKQNLGQKPITSVFVMITSDEKKDLHNHYLFKVMHCL